MKAVDYLKEKTRMCKAIECKDCLMSMHKNSNVMFCGEFERRYPEKAVEIVENWAKEHPIKTYLSVLFEKFPNTKLGEDDCPKLCPTSIFNIRQECPKISCVDCWNREYKESKNGN